jgi:hypothetical protein
MTMLPTLEEGLRRAADARETRGGVRGRLSSRVVALAAAVTVGVAGVAAAAGGLLPLGDDAPDQASPSVAHVGDLAAGTAKLLDVSVDDPDGGLRWGLRVYQTSAGATCLQPGRVQDSVMGVIGDDGRFHPQSPQVHSCQGGGTPEGLSGRSVLLADGALPLGRCAPAGSASPLPACDPAQLRTISFGVRDGRPFIDVQRGAKREQSADG